MTLICAFEIPGYCQPKQRTFGRSFVTPPETRAYEKMVRQLGKIAMRGKPPWRGFVGLEIEIICLMPTSWSVRKRHLAATGKLFPTFCDLDNQVKALGDSMNGVVYEDDRFVNSLVARREYGPEEKAIVRVIGLPPEN